MRLFSRDAQAKLTQQRRPLAEAMAKAILEYEEADERRRRGLKDLARLVQSQAQAEGDRTALALYDAVHTKPEIVEPSPALRGLDESCYGVEAVKKPKASKSPPADAGPLGSDRSR